MEQMDKELAKVKTSRSSAPNKATAQADRPQAKAAASRSNGRHTVIDDDDEDRDDDDVEASMAAMDAELASLLKSAQSFSGKGMGKTSDRTSGEDDDAMDVEQDEFERVLRGDGGGGDAGDVDDLNLVKNFLESFQSQGGFAGPVGNLVGRMGFQLPRDEPESSGSSSAQRRK